MQYGETPIQDTAAQYGYGNPTGIDLPERGVRAGGEPDHPEQAARAVPEGLPQPAAGTRATTSRWPSGRAHDLTPLQQAVAYATFANGGTRYQPQVAAAVVVPDGKVVQKFAPKVAGTSAYRRRSPRPCSQGLEGAIDSPYGTGYTAFEGRRFNLNSFPLAGKTGTATVEPGRSPPPGSSASGPSPTPSTWWSAMIDQGGYGVNAAAPAVQASTTTWPPIRPRAPGIPPRPRGIRRRRPCRSPTAPSTTTTTRPGSATDRRDHDHHDRPGPEPGRAAKLSGRSGRP